ncbi:DUF6327 family protein [Flavobacterium caeni]|uniref:Uncharacterized protein n=1 Tax=Flavobacterium caeni TaxID=490189 RepID=A0A1G5JD81_9FLAO|nr:DUF6327 family protein [Flavobacterium caeni]SCY85881.1 hypothetical protein SAMN02927903_02635 [Flavobacterium caeni]
MEKKRYSSYAEIDRDLEILKIEKDIEYQKLLVSLQQTRESFTPQNMVKSFLGSLPSFDWKEALRQSYGSILNMAIPLIMGWLSKKKRGQ